MYLNYSLYERLLLYKITNNSNTIESKNFYTICIYIYTDGNNKYYLLHWLDKLLLFCKTRAITKIKNDFIIILFEKFILKNRFIYF